MKKIIAAFAALFLLASCGPAKQPTETYTSKVPKTIETPAFGAVSSPKVVTIQIFSDFECPSCQILHKEVIPKLQKEYADTGKIRLEYKNFPLMQHDNAMGDALAGLYAHSKGKYLEFADKMYALEMERAGKPVNNADRVAIIQSIGLDGAELQKSLDEGWYVNEVEKELKE